MRLPPLLLHYYITEQCNCRCAFCDIWPQAAPERAQLADVTANLDAAAQLGVRFVDFTGGEPLLHPELPEMLRYAKKKRLRTTITTNGLLYPQCARELAGKIDFLHFSLDAATAAEHDNMRGAKAFTQVMESIDVARTLGEKPDILFTATAINLHHLPALSEWTHRLGLILIVNPVFSHHQKRELTCEQIQEIERYRKKPGVYVNTALHALRQKGGNDTRHPDCRVMDAVVVISPQNELLVPCYHFARERIPLQKNLAALWHSDRLARPRAQQGRWDLCQGCVLNCYFDPGFIYRLDVWFAKSMRAKIKYSFDKYIRYRGKRWLGVIDPRPAYEILERVIDHRE